MRKVGPSQQNPAKFLWGKMFKTRWIHRIRTPQLNSKIYFLFVLCVYGCTNLDGNICFWKKRGPERRSKYISLINVISPYVYTVTVWEMTHLVSKGVFSKIQKTADYFYVDYSFPSINLNSISWPSPFKLAVLFSQKHWLWYKLEMSHSLISLLHICNFIL